MTQASPATYDDDLRAPPVARLAGLALGALVLRAVSLTS